MDLLRDSTKETKFGIYRKSVYLEHSFIRGAQKQNYSE